MPGYEIIDLAQVGFSRHVVIVNTKQLKSLELAVEFLGDIPEAVPMLIRPYGGTMMDLLSRMISFPYNEGSLEMRFVPFNYSTNFLIIIPAQPFGSTLVSPCIVGLRLPVFTAFTCNFRSSVQLVNLLWWKKQQLFVMSWLASSHW